MRRDDLTFSVVDDLVAAHARGRLSRATPDVHFAPVTIGPLIELSYESTNGREGPLLSSPWLDHLTQIDLRTALKSTANTWFDTSRRRGFIRTVFNPLNPDDDVVRTTFLRAAKSAAETAGLSSALAMTLTAAIREMESNIFEHSERSESGLLAFQAGRAGFEFVAADAGTGVLATLREAREFQELTDHGRALHLTLQENVSRHGRDPDHGNGFRDLFAGLASLNANVRFRSGDHALTISGARPDLKAAHLSQKAPFQGLLASVQCFALQPQGATH
jgi:anti-sigma regulatory factor (Ser/Thr protein kinase)